MSELFRTEASLEDYVREVYDPPVTNVIQRILPSKDTNFVKSLLWKFFRNRKNSSLWKNTEELIHSWKAFLEKYVYFKTKQLLKTYARAIPKQFVTESPTISPVPEPPQDTDEKERACLFRAGQQGRI